MKILLKYWVLPFFLIGCSWVSDIPKSVWGSSTRVLSEKRDEAISREFSCSVQSCFDAVLEMTLPYKEVQEQDQFKFVLFLQNRKQGALVVMGVPGCVDTTEVGVFFSDKGGGQTAIEISSLSSRAKDAAAQVIFDRLSQQFFDDARTN